MSLAKEKWLVIDSHAHFLPEEAVARTRVSGGFDYAALLKGELRIPYEKAQDIEGLLRVMEDARVDMAVLNQSAWSVQVLEVCQALNDGYARIKREYPGRFILCGHVPLQGGKETIDEVERCISELGLQSISLPCSMPDVFLDAPQLWPIYDKISRLDVPVVIHPSVRFPIWGGGAKYNLHRTISREYDIAKSCVEVLYGVLKDFPNLKFIFPHYGGGMQALIVKLRAWFLPEGWNIPDSARGFSKTPSELEEFGLAKAFDELFDKLYFDTAGYGWYPIVKGALLTIKPQRTCFGTDYPFDSMFSANNIRQFVNIIKEMDIPDTDKRLILGENIKRLFKI